MKRHDYHEYKETGRMKCKVTSRELREHYGDNIVSIGYCAAQHLLRGVEPLGYNSGVYGWNYDAYDLDGLCIVTGYRSMPGRSMPYGLVNRYDEEARKAIEADWCTDITPIRAAFLAALREELDE